MGWSRNINNKEDVTTNNTKAPDSYEKPNTKSKSLKKNKLIQTSITIKSEKLNEHLSRILIRNNLVDLVTGICGIVTGMTLVTGYFNQPENDLSLFFKDKDDFWFFTCWFFVICVFSYFYPEYKETSK